MKKKIFVSMLIVLALLIFASTAFAYDVSFTTYEKSAGSWYLSLNMYGKNVCTISTTNGAGCFHKVYLKKNGSQSSSMLTVENGGPGGTVYLYPWESGTHNLMIYNYYHFGQGTLRVKGTFKNLYI